MSSIHQCLQCSKEFIPGVGCIGKFCSKSCNAKYHNKIGVFGTRSKPKTPNAKCLQCDKDIFKPNKFCGHSCCAIYNNNIRSIRLKIENKPKKKKSKYPKSFCRISWCKVCGRLIPNEIKKSCSSVCKSILFSNAGKNSAQSQNKRSNQEIQLFDLCKLYFNSVRHNEQLVDGWDADIIIDDCKIAILWNGPWHYQQMPLNNHSLSQVQNRDRIKIEKLTNAGWKVLIYEARSFTPKSAFIDIKNNIN